MDISLEQILKTWDGKRTELLQHYYREYGCEEEGKFLVQLIKDPTYQKGASWLLKHHLEQKGKISAQVQQELTKHLKALDLWEARLHLLQIIPLIKILPSTLLVWEDFVRANLDADNKFIRAWALQGLFELSLLRPELQQEVQFLCDKALQHEAASVQARVRKIVEKLQKLNGKKK